MALTLLFTFSAVGGELYGVHFNDQEKVDGQDLILNGMGLRSVNRWGLKIKVYVVGLYLPKKDCTVEGILKSQGPKQFLMVFKRSVDSEAIEDGWKTGFLKNCGKTCAENREKLTQFNHFMSDMREGQKILVTVSKDKVHVKVEGRRPAEGTIEGASFADVVQRIWLGTTPPNEELKQGLIGVCEKAPAAEKKAG